MLSFVPETSWISMGFIEDTRQLNGYSLIHYSGYSVILTFFYWTSNQF